MNANAWYGSFGVQVPAIVFLLFASAALGLPWAVRRVRRKGRKPSDAAGAA